MEEKDERDIAGYRRLTFAGITVAAVATITSIVVVPILFSQAQTIQSQLDVELRFCVMSTHNLFDELVKVRCIAISCLKDCSFTVVIGADCPMSSLV